MICPVMQPSDLPMMFPSDAAPEMLPVETQQNTGGLPIIHRVRFFYKSHPPSVPT